MSLVVGWEMEFLVLGKLCFFCFGDIGFIVVRGVLLPSISYVVELSFFPCADLSYPVCITDEHIYIYMGRSLHINVVTSS